MERVSDVPAVLEPYVVLIRNLLTSPEGYKPHPIYFFNEDGETGPYHEFNMAMPTLYAQSGVTDGFRAMLYPQEYFFTEATMAAREFVEYLRLFADVIEQRLPSPVGTE